jgi:phosphate transport system protein
LNTHPHLEESLRRDINSIRGKVSEMAALSQGALKASVRALTERNRQLAYSIILRDQYIDELEVELDRLCLEFLARHQPVAKDLRFIFSTIHINRELERIGDYAESIARQVLAVSSLEPQVPYEKFVELGDLAVHMLHDAVHSFIQQDAGLATRTMIIEERANTLRTSINADLRELSKANQLPAASFTPLLTIARRLERVTDQAKNLCEEVLYMCTGESIKHKGVEAFRILFLDATNGSLSQMAEAISSALHQPRFIFCSAGFTPQPLDGRTVEFMASKGIDISRYASKSLDQLPGWEQYQVIVCLSPQVREAVPHHPGKTIYFTWHVKNPSATEGPPDGVRSAFEEAYQSLESQIKDLVGAILQEPQPELKL